jgi:hypothetical protein
LAVPTQASAVVVVADRLPEGGFAAKLMKARTSAAETRRSPTKIRGIRNPF